MAQLIRSARSGSDWTANELASYNIAVVHQDGATFFETPNLPQPAVNPNVLTTLDYNNSPDDDTYSLIRNLDLAMVPATSEESAVGDFAVVLLRALGYEPRGRTLRTRKDLPFIICGESRHAKADVCLIDEQDIVLLVQEGKRQTSPGEDPEPQLIAAAVAAFTLNIRNRVENLGIPPLPSKLFAGISLTGTAPVFYKINVTAELVTAISGGGYPETLTVVYAHLPVVPRRPHRRWGEGMKPLDNRRVILSCYEAFKRFVN
ncbi:hypothetical protein FA13DRAFT_1420359 [Coprinellus micaceus]|uniref:Uncharacterized protein n=1 Tax=Coprinellus micaceus TaxID=71717 RepID=A0A4Y7SND7_COPMI|nr:hypothetical protein FA13DRAFT_1420359 [Coprinellus micaceus]